MKVRSEQEFAFLTIENLFSVENLLISEDEANAAIVVTNYCIKVSKQIHLCQMLKGNKIQKGKWRNRFGGGNIIFIKWAKV